MGSLTVDLLGPLRGHQCIKLTLIPTSSHLSSGCREPCLCLSEQAEVLLGLVEGGRGQGRQPGPVPKCLNQTKPGRGLRIGSRALYPDPYRDDGIWETGTLRSEGVADGDRADLGWV